MLYSYAMPIAFNPDYAPDRFYILSEDGLPSATTKRHARDAYYLSPRQGSFCDCVKLPMGAGGVADAHIANLKHYELRIERAVDALRNRRKQRRSRSTAGEAAVRKYSELQRYRKAHTKELKGSGYRLPKHPWDTVPIEERALLAMQHDIFDPRTTQ